MLESKPGYQCNWQLDPKAIRALRRLKSAKKIRPFYDFDYCRGTSLGGFRSTGMSVQERYLVMQERRLFESAQEKNSPKHKISGSCPPWEASGFLLHFVG